MRRTAMIILLAVLAAGCGSTRHATVTTSVKAKPQPARLHVGIVGPLSVAVPGVATEHGTLAQVSHNALVLADASTVDVARIAAFADAHPATHVALVGASTKGFHRSNLVGLVLRDQQAARLAGVVAGFIAAEQGGTQARVAWVGPQERVLASAYAGGVHESLPTAAVLYAWSERIPARCKEAALGAIARGAAVVTAHGGLCADAVAVAAHQQNHIALSVSGFELPGIPAAILVRDALGGVYHGGEDLVFGATSGAIGIRLLDPRISMATALRARAAAQELASGLPPSG